MFLYCTLIFKRKPVHMGDIYKYTNLHINASNYEKVSQQAINPKKLNLSHFCIL